MLQGREIRLEACVNVRCLLSAVRQAQAHRPRSACGSSKARRLAGCRSAALAAPCPHVREVPLCALTQVGVHR